MIMDEVYASPAAVELPDSSHQTSVRVEADRVSCQAVSQKSASALQPLDPEFADLTGIGRRRGRGFTNAPVRPSWLGPVLQHRVVGRRDVGLTRVGGPRIL